MKPVKKMRMDKDQAKKKWRHRMKKDARYLEDWTELGDNLYYFKDEEGIVWQLLRTPFKEIPKVVTRRYR